MSDVTTSATSDRGFFGEANYPGIFGWIFSTDHKRIGLLYFWCIVTFFCVGVLLGLLLRLELFAPGETIMGAQTYNAVFTLHGVIMIFLFIIPFWCSPCPRISFHRRRPTRHRLDFLRALLGPDQHQRFTGSGCSFLARLLVDPHRA
jgi:hypothetical protein